MDDRLVRAFQRFERAGDQLRPALHQHLQRHVLRYAALFHAPAGEIEIGLRCGREADLDFLEPHVQKQLEHPRLAVMAHRVDQRLVAIAQVDRTPDRRLLDRLRRPSAVRNVDRRIGAILHACGLHAFYRCGNLVVHVFVLHSHPQEHFGSMPFSAIRLRILDLLWSGFIIWD
ncbi:hypothetical protein D3C71_417530 [compost metagenome]